MIPKKFIVASAELVSTLVVIYLFTGYPDEEGEYLGYWSLQRYDYMIAKRQEALDVARQQWADFLLVCYCV